MKLKLKSAEEIIYIDDNIVDEIVILNNKGYKTMACCGGHLDRQCHVINVVFDKDYGFVAPKYFKIYADGVGLAFHVSQGSYKPYIKYNKAMVIFKQWVKDLPKIN